MRFCRPALFLSLCLFSMAGVSAPFPGERLFLDGDAAERAGRPADAVSAYESCAAADPDLAPYALSRAAQARAKAGDADGAEARWRDVLKKHPDGPWVRMVSCRLAGLLAERGGRAGARTLFKGALEVSPRPWFMDDWAWAAAENLFADPATRKEALPFYRDVVETTILLEPRKKAARALLQTGEPADRALGAWGLLRSGAMDEAKPVFDMEPVHFQDSSKGGTAMQILDSLFATFPGPAPESETRLTALARANRDHPWMRVWLLYAMRSAAGRKAWDTAGLFAGVLSNVYGEERDGGDALYWLAGVLAGAGDQEGAKKLYRALSDRHPGHARAAEALFALGGIEMGAGRKAEAMAVFTEMGRRFPNARQTPEAHLLCADIAARGGDAAGEKLYLSRAGAAGPGVYAAHRALARLRGGGAPPLPGTDAGSRLVAAFPGMTRPPAPPLTEAERDAGVARMFFFGEHGFEEGEWEALDCVLRAPRGDARARWYQAIAVSGHMHTLLQFVRAEGWGAGPEGPAMDRRHLEYPLAFWPVVQRIAAEAGADPYLVLAVARQESTFRARIVSRAGATGLMQLMPATAKWLGDTDKNITPEQAAHLSLPENSVRMGAFYMRRMLDRSGGNLVYALASYNGGPGNCDKWRKRFPGADMDAFVESIPFGETKDYVKKVLANLAAYHSLYPPPATMK
ncbi:MAG: transglycosylase SLT domain-containing protein [Candidatus Hydrogenedentes bacterium]|nr:transglycosylase SLT domain-containing protein [Candidatus Hydrogenedentota bacterium]